MGLIRARRNTANVVHLLDRRLQLAQLARTRELAAVWGILAAPDSEHPIRFTSQHGEDFHAWRSLGRPTSGFFVDVGAYDGVRASNSFALEQLGWHGLLIEANPASVAKCRALRPRATTVHAAVGGRRAKGSVSFKVISGRTDADMLSHVDANKEQPSALREQRTKTATVIDVPFRSLEDILDQYAAKERQIDLLTIDIEGIELPVLAALNFERWSPRLIIVEANDDAIIPFLENRSYNLISTVGANWLFLHGSSPDSPYNLPEFEFIRY